MPTKPTHLPDAMPDIEEPSLLVVCDTHRCIFLEAGKRTIVAAKEVESKKEEFTDREGRFQSPAAVGKGGLVSSAEDTNLLERNRMKEFAKNVWSEATGIVSSQKIAELHVSAPAKFLAELRGHIPSSLKGILKNELDGNFVKEAPLDLLVRFRPDLKDKAQRLHEEESYSTKKHLPK